MVDDQSSLSDSTSTQSTPAKYGERLLATCGYLLVVASIISFVVIGALQFREAWHGVENRFTTWLDLAQHEMGTFILLLIGIVTATLGKRLLTTVRLADARTIPADDLPLVQQAVIDGKPEPVDQYVRIRSLTGWSGNFTKLGVTGLPLTTVMLTLIFSFVALLPNKQADNFLDLAKLTLGAFIGSFVQRQVEQRRQDAQGTGAPRRPELPT